MFRPLLLVAAVLAAPAVQASTVQFSTLASFDAALGGPSIVSEDFTGNQLNGTIIANVTGAHNYVNNRMQNVAGANNGSQFTTITFSTALKAFAVNVGSLGAGEIANILLDGVLVGQLTGTANFFGITSTKAFTSLSFVDATRPLLNTQFNIDNVRVSAVPVVAGLPLLLSGLGLLAGVGRRSRKGA